MRVWVGVTVRVIVLASHLTNVFRYVERASRDLSSF